MGNSLEVTFAWKTLFFTIFCHILAQKFSSYLLIQKRVLKNVLIIDIAKDLSFQVFAPIKIQNSYLFTLFFFIFKSFFSDLNITPWNLSNRTTIIEFW